TKAARVSTVTRATRSRALSPAMMVNDVMLVVVGAGASKGCLPEALDRLVQPRSLHQRPYAQVRPPRTKNLAGTEPFRQRDSASVQSKPASNRSIAHPEGY